MGTSFSGTGIRVRVIIPALAILIIPLAAFAAKEAPINFERAKVEFSAGNYQDALALLEQVIQEEPENDEAYHYAGLCRMGMDQPAQALEYLEKAAAIESNAGLQEDLAWAAFEARDYDRALEAADASLALEPDREGAMLFKGKALMGKRQYDQALTVFEGLYDSEEYGQAGHYYAALCLAHQGKTAEAAAQFEAARDLGPDTPLGLESAKYLMAITGERPAEKKPWGARIRLLYQYDTNIVLVNDEDFLPEDVSDMEDGRAVLDLDGRYKFIDQGPSNLYARYMGYFSWQFEEPDFNIMFHMGELGGFYGTSSGGVGIKVGIRGNYSASWVDNEEYSAVVRGAPEATFTWSQTLRTRLVVEYEGETFDEPGEDVQDRDNAKIRATVYQHFILAGGKVNSWLGYGYAQVNADGDNYNRVVNTGHAGLVASLPLKSIGVLIATYDDRDYPDNSFDREERRTSINGSWQVPLNQWLRVYLGVVYTTVDANIEVLEYDRWIYSAGLVAVL